MHHSIDSTIGSVVEFFPDTWEAQVQIPPNDLWCFAGFPGAQE